MAVEIHITLTAGGIKPEQLTGKIAVVIDVLRATSVIVTALQNGARQIRPVASVEDALGLRMEGNLAGGERNAEKIPGFDMGNSPFEYSPERVKGKEIILTTTNGTLALSRCSRADEVIAGSFLNYRAVCEYLDKLNKPVELVCAGTNGEFSLDDFLCAGLIAETLSAGMSQTGNDLVNLALKSWREARRDIHQALSSCRHYNILKNKGLDADLDYCLLPGSIPLIPTMTSRVPLLLTPLNYP